MSQSELDTALKRLKKDKQISVYTATAGLLDRSTPEESGLPCIKIAVLRNFTIDPILPVIQAEIVLAGFYPQLYTGDFDTIANDILDPQSALYKFNPDVIIIAQWLDSLSPKLVSRFAGLTPQQLQDESNDILNQINMFISGLRKNSSAPVLINNYPLPTYPAMGILDSQSRIYQSSIVLQLNSNLQAFIQESRDVYLVDYFTTMARIGSESGIDERYWHMGRAPIGRNALVPLGQEYAKFIRAIKGKVRKCLVLDCDNTLWGGIIGEDGMEGIKLGTTYPGSCYTAFQNEIMNLHDRGVILALCSKNNEQDVMDVFQNHPDMILREENLSTWQVNWDDKATNIRRIAEDLNIGLDSLVFVDDSQFECELVMEQVPEVAVLHLSGGPATFRSELASKGFFDNLAFSAEDGKRNKMYRDQVKRKKISDSAGSLEEYLAKLEMEVEFGLADETTVLRISQLTQKTNQFNLTTHRYTVGEIKTFMENPDIDVFYIKLKDRVAEMGLIGVAIVKYTRASLCLDTFLLSCRALGRGVEEAFLSTILKRAKSRSFQIVKGKYLISKKNAQVSNFYGNMGFEMIDENNQGTDWELNLDDGIFPVPEWITIKTIGMEDF